VSLVSQISSLFLAAVAAIMALVSIIQAHALIKYRADSMEKIEKQLAIRITELSERMEQLNVLVRVQLAEQAVVNQMASKTMESMINRLNRQEEILMQFQQRFSESHKSD